MNPSDELRATCSRWIEMGFRDLDTYLAERKNDTQNIDVANDCNLFGDLGFILGHIETLEAHGYDCQNFRRLAEMYIERIKELYTKRIKGLQRIKQDLLEMEERYREEVSNIEKEVSQDTIAGVALGDLLEFCFDFRSAIGNIIRGLIATSLDETIELKEIHSLLSESDNRLKKHIPIIAKTHADVVRAFDEPSTYPPSDWWIHELQKYYNEYRSNLPAGTAERRY